MRTLLVCCGLGLIGCSTGAQMSNADSRALEPVFNDWKNAIIEGKFEYIYSHTSASMKSKWLYDIFTPAYLQSKPVYGPVAASSIKRLPADLNTDFENWLRMNLLNQTQESLVGPLPSTIMKSEWLKETLKEHFEREQPKLKHDFAAKEFRDAYIDGDAATLTVLNIRRESEMYEVVKEDDVWKLNYWKPSPPKK